MADFLVPVVFIVRFLCFQIHESPKYLMGKGKDEEAVRVVHEVARRNGQTTRLTVEDLRACEPEGYQRSDSQAGDAIKRRMQVLSSEHVRPLFSSPKLAWSTTGLMIIWAFIGLG